MTDHTPQDPAAQPRPEPGPDRGSSPGLRRAVAAFLAVVAVLALVAVVVEVAVLRPKSEQVQADRNPSGDVTYTGGAATLMGEDSWKWLLMQPLSGQE